MKKFICVLMAIGLIVSLTVVIGAEEQIPSEEASVYFLKEVSQNQELLFFTDVRDVSSEDLLATLKINQQKDRCTANPVLLSERPCPVHYLFLVDNSNSLKLVQDHVKKFMSDLAEKDQDPTVRYGLATFGNQVDVISWEQDTKEFVSTVNELRFEQDGIKNTSLEDGIWDFLDLLKEKRQETWEFIHVVIVTDGMSGSEKIFGHPEHSMNEIANRIAANHSILVHTVNVQNENVSSLRDIGTGCHLALNNQSVEQCAGEIVKFSHNLSMMKFAVYDVQPPVSGEIYLSRYGMKDPIYSISLKNILYWNDEGVFLPAPDSDEGGFINDTPENQNGDVEHSSEENTEEGGAKKTGKLGKVLLITFISLLGTGVVVVVILIVLGKNKKTHTPCVKIFMKLEVISGQCKTQQREFYLKDELIIGKSAQCDIVFKDSEISRQNTRIYVEGPLIFIEDMNSATGTALENVRLREKNRLRSGDEISIGGSVRFKFLF